MRVLALSACLVVAFSAVADAQPRSKRVYVQPAAATCAYYQDLTRLGPTGYGRTVCNPVSTAHPKTFWDFQDRRGGGTGTGGSAQ